MKKEKKPEHFLQKPKFPGGKEGMKEFVQKNLRYPQEALVAKIEGSVEVEYKVNGLGKVLEANVLKGVGHGCDEEAVRLVLSFPFQKAVNRGLRTTFTQKVTIHFKLPPAPSVKVNYTLTKSVEKPKKENTSKSYQITLNVNR